jgi:hypothetical protein
VPKKQIFYDFLFRFCSYCTKHTRRTLITRQIVGFAPPMSPASTATSKMLQTPTPMPTPTPTPQSRKRRAGSTLPAQIQWAVAAATAPRRTRPRTSTSRTLRTTKISAPSLRRRARVLICRQSSRKSRHRFWREAFKNLFFDADSAVYMRMFAVTYEKSLVTKYRGTCELYFHFN